MALLVFVVYNIQEKCHPRKQIECILFCFVLSTVLKIANSCL